jgi:hypothetical protein
MKSFESFELGDIVRVRLAGKIVSAKIIDLRVDDNDVDIADVRTLEDEPRLFSAVECATLRFQFRRCEGMTPVGDHGAYRTVKVRCRRTSKCGEVLCGRHLAGARRTEQAERRNSAWYGNESSASIVGER